VAGAFPIIDAHHTLKIILEELPVVHVQNWTELTQGILIQQLESILDDKHPLRWEKLTIKYWRNFILDRH
jgi:hypothetical protein